MRPLLAQRRGTNKSVRFDDIYDLHTRYLKGLSEPYFIASSEHDRHIQENAKVKPISEEDYHTSVEKVTGACQCGGHYRFHVPPRCSKCKSTNIEEGEPGLFYD